MKTHGAFALITDRRYEQIVMNNPGNENSNYPFLHSHIAREPHIFDVLDEISKQQALAIADANTECSTLENLKKSYGIRIPNTPMRNKTIAYLLDLLVKTYPEEIKTILSFRFSADPQTKKMSIEEIIEYTVLMNHNDYNTLQGDRDEKSAVNLNTLLLQFRFFNLTKLQMKVRGKEHLARILSSEINKNIFVFKFYSHNKNNFELEEDYCFHKQNYPSVAKSIKIADIQQIIHTHSKHIAIRLKKYGIFNTDVTDYRDNKLDYLINILLNDISSFLGEKTLDEVKNFVSLRTCLLEFDKESDPLLVLGNDIATYIKKHDEIVTGNELLEVFGTLTSELLTKWAEENCSKNKIIIHKEDDGNLSFIDYANFVKSISSLHNEIILHQNEFASQSVLIRQEKIKSFKTLYMIGQQLLASSELTKEVLNSDQLHDEIRQIINDYDEDQRRINLRNSLVQKNRNRRKKKSFMASIIKFFLNILKKSRPVRRLMGGGFASEDDHVIRVTNETQDIYANILKSTLPIIPLSDYIDISPNNDIVVDSIISKLRSSKRKIVIPIYNARENLYPLRSRKYIIADVEYIIVDKGVIKSGETVRDFTNSIQDIIIKEETIPVSAVMQIEKYLLTLQRKKK